MRAEPGQPLSVDDVQRLLSTELVQGIEYVYGPDNIAADRDRNYDYYRGIMADLPAPASRSRVVEMTVANYIGLMKPNLLRIFTAGRNIAEYVCPKPEYQQVVKLITRFINDVVFRKDNRGELLLNDWADDGLIQKLGIVMWWWDEKVEQRDEVYENIATDWLGEIARQVKERGGEIIEHTSVMVESQTPQGAMVEKLHTIKARMPVNLSTCRIETIPPEEFICSRDARSVDDAILLAHRTGVAVGDLIAAGYNADQVNALPTFTEPYPDRTRKYNQTQVNDPNRDQSSDAMLRKVGVMRGIVRCNADGTGIKEWFFVAGGDENAPKILDFDAYNEQIGFADFCPEPLPHTVYGRCPADRLAMIQKINTVLVRQLNDNLFLSNTPQREVVMDLIVKPDQLMNMAPGAPILVKAPNAIREIAVPFVADKALLAMQYYDGQAELTAGVGRNSAGLDPEALANQSATASNNQQSAMLGRVEHIARIWAHGGMRKLFRGVFKCIKNYQDFARVVQIDGKPETIDPRKWDGLDDVDVNINTGLGTGNRERDFAMLTQIAAEQKEALQLLGPGNPVVDLKKIVRTSQLKAEAAGIAYPENFFGDPGDWQIPVEEPKPTPDTIYNSDALVRAEEVKAQSSEAKEVARIASEERVKVYEINVRAGLEGEKNKIDSAKVLIEAAKVDVSAAKNASDELANRVTADLNRAKFDREGDKKDDKHDGAMAVALTAVADAVKASKAPRTIKRDDKGRAVGLE